jgi:RNA polymerase sigma-B factor
MGARELARQTGEELLDRHYRGRDLAAREELVDRFTPFAGKLAARYTHSREPIEDLMQVASIGLRNAIDRFDPEHGKKFTAFAAPTIVGELKRYFRDTAGRFTSRATSKNGRRRSAVTSSSCRLS